MSEHWQLLVGNFAVVALFISAWVHLQVLFVGKPPIVRKTAFGVVMGLGAVATMLLAVRESGGLMFDLRSSLIALASFFGGPVAGLLAVLIAAGYRALAGGPVAWLGCVGAVLAAFVGLGVSRVTRGRVRPIWSVGLLALAVGCLGPAINGVVRVTGLMPLPEPSLTLAALNICATALSAFFVMRHRVLERERDLLRAAFMQSPDYQYVKSREGRFVAVNIAVARHHGFSDPRELLGKTDFDLAEHDRAEELFAEEQNVISTGRGFADHEELLTDVTGRPKWFSTTKVPLHSSEGEIVGLAGVTRDITQRKLLERSAAESGNQLSSVLAGISDGIAMFGPDGRLVYSNAQYRELFPLTANHRKPGAHLRDILRAVVATGEQVVPRGQEERWIEDITASLKRVSEEEAELYDGRWLHIRTRPTPDGAAMVVVSDVTRIKHAEATLLTMTEQLKLLATTDGLTGLTNRRAFDTALEIEMSRARRDGTPLSLLIADVDRFKSYNDIYGHQAGDEVLKRVGECFKQAMRRPTDVAARYGGEEFVAILPGTDEDGAFFIADAFRESLHALNIPHEGGDKKFITTSVGLATFTSRDGGLNATELVRRADEGLYNAKGAGRDRVTGWRPRFDIRPVGGMRL